MMQETSYNNKYGSGNRKNRIKITHAEGHYFPLLMEKQELLFDGNESTFVEMRRLESTDSITFEFSHYIGIDEIKFIGRQRSQYGNRYKIIADEQVLVEDTGTKRLDQGISFPYTKLKVLTIQALANGWIASNGGAIFEIYEINFKTGVINENILIKKDNQYGYYTDSFQSLGTSYPTKEQFEQYGMSDLSMLEARDIPVEYEMELINQTEEKKCFSYTFDLNGQHKNMKSIDGIITE